jgi:hypothetical protein
MERFVLSITILSDRFEANGGVCDVDPLNCIKICMVDEALEMNFMAY